MPAWALHGSRAARPSCASSRLPEARVATSTIVATKELRSPVARASQSHHQQQQQCQQQQQQSPFRRRRDVLLPPCRAGFLGSLFGGKPPTLPGSGSSSPASAASDRRPPPLEDDLGPDDPDEVVLVETAVASVPGRRCRIVYRCNGAPVDAARVEALCAKVGWPQRPRAKLEAALRNSFLVASLYLQVVDGEGEGGDGASGNGSGNANGGSGAPPPQETLVGLARATSDHAFNATIWDVIVDPEYQGQGLGRALVEQLVRALLRREIGNVTLFADARVVDFYRQMGFEADPDGIKGMFWYPR